MPNNSNGVRNGRNIYPDACYLEDGSIVDPGAGYRLLEVGETRQVGDEYLKAADGSWVKIDLDHIELLGSTVRYNASAIRRKVSIEIDPNKLLEWADSDIILLNKLEILDLLKSGLKAGKFNR